jgi:hypothetical protein
VISFAGTCIKNPGKNAGVCQQSEPPVTAALWLKILMALTFRPMPGESV